MNEFFPYLKTSEIHNLEKKQYKTDYKKYIKKSNFVYNSDTQFTEFPSSPDKLLNSPLQINGLDQ